jgi:hypothetical protein
MGMAFCALDDLTWDVYIARTPFSLSTLLLCGMAAIGYLSFEMCNYWRMAEELRGGERREGE